METTMPDVIMFILAADESQVSTIASALRNRRQTLNGEKEAMNRASMYVGDRVVISNIKPKALDGARGVITSVDGDYAKVLLDRPVHTSTRTRTEPLIPWSCLTKIDS